MIYAPVLGYSAREEQATLIGVKVRSPNERPSHQRVYARLATRSLGREIRDRRSRMSPSRVKNAIWLMRATEIHAHRYFQPAPFRLYCPELSIRHGRA